MKSVVLFFLSVNILFGQQGWLPYKNSATLNSIAVGDENTFYAAGLYLNLLKTTNRGDSWTQITPPFIRTGKFQVGFSDIYCRDANTLYITLHNKKILKSTDGGATWTIRDNPAINAISFANEMRGFTVGTSGAIYKTTNAGDSWNRVNINFNVEYQDIEFSDSLNGLIAGSNGVVLKTTDAGENWSRIDIPTGYYANISYPQKNYAFIASGNQILKSTNGGLNWQHINPPAIANYDIICFTGKDTGYIGSINKVYKTTNGGDSWMPLLHPYPIGANDLITLNDLVVTVGSKSFISKSSDAGATWQITNKFQEGELFKVRFYDNLQGIIVGVQTILRTYDGGNSFDSPLSPGTFNDIIYIDQNTLVGIGKPGIMRSTDGGSTWQVQAVASGITRLKRMAAKDNIIITIGDDGFIYRSSDYGLTWTQLPPIYGYDICVRGDEFIISSGLGRLYRSNDGGITWQLQETNIYKALNRIKFLNESIGWINGIYKTTDGGESWSTIPYFPIDMKLREFDYADENNGIVVGSTGEIHQTRDGGLTWYQQPSYTYDNLNSVYMIDNQNGIIAGKDIMLITRDGGYTFVQENYSGIQKPEHFSLAQNYPNPFNPSTTIRYTVSEEGDVLLDIYNLLGEKIAVLVDGVKAPGVYEIKWNAGKIPGGIYFYRLAHKNKIIVNKMMLLK
jgi:photosystem II stability/assembly factor-like uncharacterized protein